MPSKKQANQPAQKEMTITDVRYYKTHLNQPFYRFQCTCGNTLDISGSDSGDPVECPDCGMTWDIHISVTGSMPDGE